MKKGSKEKSLYLRQKLYQSTNDVSKDQLSDLGGKELASRILEFYHGREYLCAILATIVLHRHTSYHLLSGAQEKRISSDRC